jgi:hypothetical protein
MPRFLFCLVFVLFFLSAQNLFSQEQKLPFYPNGIYNPDIPSPESFLGFNIGDKPARYDETVGYLKLLSEKSKELKIIEMGETYEKRKLYCILISSKENLARIDDIKNAISQLADPRKTSEIATKNISESTPAIAWMAYGIHGDELSSTDASLQLAYQLTACTDENTVNLKKELVVLIDPMENPDGRERALAQLQQLSGEIINSDIQSIQHTGIWPGGRGNHYLFDSNRDWFALTHPETRARVKTVLEWNPQIFVDSHEMGSFDTYLFSPAGPPLNPNINEFNKKWRNKFAVDQAKAFDNYGWSYYTRDWNDEWYPGYGSGWSLFIGAIGILYEQAGTDGLIVKRPDGTTLTFRESVHHHFVSSIANLTTTAKNRKDLLKEFYSARKSDMEIKKGAPASFYLVPGKNETRINKLIEKLMLQKIEVKVAEKDFQVSDLHNYWNSKTVTKTLPKGTYIISLDQPMGRLAKTILEFDPRMDNSALEKERKKLEKEKQSTMYDITGWSLPISYNIESYWSEKKNSESATLVKSINQTKGKVENPQPKFGYLIEYYDDKAISVLEKLFEDGFKVRSAKETFEIGGKSYSRGTLLIRLNENPKSIQDEMQKISDEYGINIYGVNTALSTKGSDLGGNDFVLLEQPKIALLAGPQVSTGSFSTIWQLLDYRMKFRISLLSSDALAYFDLQKYNVIILPSSNSPQSYNQLFGKEGIGKLKKWVEAGGTLIGISNAAALLADTSSGFSKVRLRSQVLGDLDIYNDALTREDQIDKIKVDSVAIWEGTVSSKADTTKDKKSPPKDIKELERQDERLRLYSPHGAILAVELDEENWLNYGAGDKVGAITNGSIVFLSKDPVQTAGRFCDAKDLRLSGLLWPEARERWKRSAYLTRESMSNGQIILFAGEPNFRSFFNGTERLLLNAIFLGPGFGASKTVEWK